MGACLEEPRVDSNHVSASEVFWSAIERVEESAALANVSLVLRCDGGVLRGDGQTFTDAFVHIISSAIDGAEAGSAITVEAKIGASGRQLWTVRGPRRGTGDERTATVTLYLPTAG